MIYQAKKEGKKKEDMCEYVLERISLTLPQDILLNMEIGGTRLNYSELAFLLTQLSTYLKAGIPLIDSIKISLFNSAINVGLICIVLQPPHSL